MAPRAEFPHGTVDTPLGTLSWTRYVDAVAVRGEGIRVNTVPCNGYATVHWEEGEWVVKYGEWNLNRTYDGSSRSLQEPSLAAKTKFATQAIAIAKEMDNEATRHRAKVAQLWRDWGECLKDVADLQEQLRGRGADLAAVVEGLKEMGEEECPNWEPSTACECFHCTTKRDLEET